MFNFENNAIIDVEHINPDEYDFPQSISEDEIISEYAPEEPLLG